MCRKLSPARVLRESIAAKVGLTAAPEAAVRVGNAINTVILMSGSVPAVNVVSAVVAVVNVIVQAEHAALVLAGAEVGEVGEVPHYSLRAQVPCL